MATQRQTKAFEIRAEKLKGNKKVLMGEVMRAAGYPVSTSRIPKKLTESKGWQELLAQYDDKPIMDAIYQDALDKQDKRNATENRKLILRLKNRFPASKMKIGAFDERDEVLKDDEDNIEPSSPKEDRLESPPKPREDTEK